MHTAKRKILVIQLFWNMFDSFHELEFMREPEGCRQCHECSTLMQGSKRDGNVQE